MTLDYGPERRLHRKREFALAFERGVTVRDSHLKVAAVANGLGHARLGSAVSKRVSRESVGRNRVRRRIREAFRTAYPLLPQGLDLVVTPLEGTKETPFTSLVESLLALARKAEERLAKRAK